jgi:hypothetical protein
MSRHFLNEFIKLWVARNYYLERVAAAGWQVQVAEGGVLHATEIAQKIIFKLLQRLFAPAG